MSDNPVHNPQPEALPEEPVEEQQSTASASPDQSSQAEETTIGTGTSMALGCIAGTVLLIGFGLLFLFLSTLR